MSDTPYYSEVGGVRTPMYATGDGNYSLSRPGSASPSSSPASLSPTVSVSAETPYYSEINGVRTPMYATGDGNYLARPVVPARRQQIAAAQAALQREDAGLLWGDVQDTAPTRLAPDSSAMTRRLQSARAALLDPPKEPSFIDSIFSAFSPEPIAEVVELPPTPRARSRARRPAAQLLDGMSGESAAPLVWLAALGVAFCLFGKKK